MPTFTVNIPGGRIGSFLAGAAVASVIGGTAVAITSPDFTYSTTKTGYYIIDTMSLAPRDAESANDYFIDYTASEVSGVACFQTGVNLPNGSSVNSVTTWLQSDGDVGVQFLRHNVPGGTFQTLIDDFIEDTAGRSPITHTIPANLRPVNNQFYGYGYAICMTGNEELFGGARITYTYKSAGD